MAKMNLYVEDVEYLFPFGDFGAPELALSGSKKAIFTETEAMSGDMEPGPLPNGDYLVIKGTGLTYDEGTLVGGKITSMILFNVDGVKYAQITDLKFDAADLPSYSNNWGTDVSALMLAGNDKITGNDEFDILAGYGGKDVMRGLGGGDYFYGGVGRDILTGGKGLDKFFIATGDGHDVITDFGSPGTKSRNHDLIFSDATDYDVSQKGNDTYIDFNDGTSVLLMDFKMKNLDSGDIIL